MHHKFFFLSQSDNVDVYWFGPSDCDANMSVFVVWFCFAQTKKGWQWQCPSSRCAGEKKHVSAEILFAFLIKLIELINQETFLKHEGFRTVLKKRNC